MSLAPGGYLNTGSPLHRLDSRAKVLGTVLLLVGVFGIDTGWGYACAAILLIALARIGRIPGIHLARAIRAVGMLLFLTVLLNAFFTPGQPLGTLAWLPITQEGVLRGLALGSRLTLLVAISALLTATTSPLSLAGGLESLLRPLRILRIPVPELAMVSSIALRFIPILVAEAERIARAQAGRGAHIDTGPALRRVLALAPILIPLFAGALQRAEDLGAAMEARGYVPGAPRSRLHPPETGVAEIWALVSMATLAGVFWIWL